VYPFPIVLLSSGTRLGAFEIVSLLGTGGMGEVYRARDTRLNRTVAVKILNSDKVGHPQRFQREARAISRLSHPHICSLYDIGDADGTAFLVMEYLEGRTLADRLRDGAIPLEQALRHGIEICDALDRAHRERVIHRDVKPGNVMLTREGAKLLDFGLAKFRQAEGDGIADDTTASLHLTQDGEMVGTVLYMAPEQLEGRESDARTDIFAFGVVLYEMITGRQPFTGGSRASIIAAILTSDPPSISTLQPLAPPRLDRLLKRCLAKNPDERWQTARDLAYELRGIVEEGTQPANVEQGRKNRGMLLGALIGAGLVGAVSIGAWILRPADASPPSYQRLTFRRGIISSARFAPDGQTVIFSAAWDARPYELFLARLGSPESRSLGMANGRILSVSSTGEMAVLLGTQSFFGGVGTLARASLAGGLPREVLEDVTEADWGPDGALAVVKQRGNKMELEFPVGTKLYETRAIWSIRVSPKGDRVAFFESHGPGDTLGVVVVVDRSLNRTTLTKPAAALGLAWSSRGDEVWFTGARSDGPPAIRAVSLSGRERLVERVPAPLKIDDISREGRVLVTKGLNLGGITCLIPGDTRERDVGWLDNARVEGLSADTKTLLFGATEGNWIAGVYTRATEGSPAVRLSDGHPESLSPDGKWVLARAPGASSAWGREWVLVPTGPGSPRLLPRGAITRLVEGTWLPDGKRIVFTAIEGARAARGYVQEVETGLMRPITPEGVRMPEKAASPDGRSVLVMLDGKWLLYPIDGGQPHPVSVLGSSDNPLQWSADGRFLYVVRRRGFVPPIAIERLNVSTGRREPWKTLIPSDPVGVEYLDPPVISPDGRAYCYSYARRHQELYVVEGLK
jgi:eukaryotic-like serine/threonine-protein kinase